jgi:exodeoxyribonuclease-3
MKVATFNVNGIRARLEIVLDWLAVNNPDVLAIQETKVEDEKFPVAEFEDLGWNVAIHGQKSYNGVALVSRHAIAGVTTGFNDLKFPEDCRLISGVVNGVTILNSYVPNGTEVGTEKFAYKIRWMKRFRMYLEQRFKPSDRVIWLGDVNVAPTEEDLFEPQRHRNEVGFHPDEHAALKIITDWGWVDLFRKFTQGPGYFTFWEFVIPKSFERNLGWRIDHIYAPYWLSQKCGNCFIDKRPRAMEKPSDHTPVVAVFEL